MRAQVRSRGRSPLRIGIVVALVLLAVSAVPPFLSQRYVDDAYAEWRTDLPRAYDDLEPPRSLNRLSDLPLLAEGSIAQASGDRERALAAFREAEAKRPEEWATHYLLAELLMRSDRAAAREQIRQALELNPLDVQIQALAKQAPGRPSSRAAWSSSDAPISPRCRAIATACARVRAPSFALALRTWVWTVAGESSSRSAIWPSVAPSASSARISRSRAEGSRTARSPTRGPAPCRSLPPAGSKATR